MPPVEGVEAAGSDWRGGDVVLSEAKREDRSPRKEGSCFADGEGVLDDGSSRHGFVFDEGLPIPNSGTETPALLSFPQGF